jgi:hypothetical protein
MSAKAVSYTRYLAGLRNIVYLAHSTITGDDALCGRNMSASVCMSDCGAGSLTLSDCVPGAAMCNEIKV